MEPQDVLVSEVAVNLNLATQLLKELLSADVGLEDALDGHSMLGAHGLAKSEALCLERQACSCLRSPTFTVGRLVGRQRREDGDASQVTSGRRR